MQATNHTLWKFISSYLMGASVHTCWKQ